MPGDGYAATFTSDDQVLVLGHRDGDGITFVDSSDPNPANWTEVVNSNISIVGVLLGRPGLGLTFTADDSILVLAHGSGDYITFVDSSDSSPANWTEIINTNISLPGPGRAVAFTSDENILAVGHDGTLSSPKFITFIDSSDPDPANWTEIINTNIILPGRYTSSVTFTSDDQTLVLTHEIGVTFVDSSDPNPANWDEITNNVSLPSSGYAATFTSDDQVLVLGHAGGDGVTFVDSSDPDPANWTEITNNNVSLPHSGTAATFTSDDQVLVLGHYNFLLNGALNYVTFVDSSDPSPANWTEITNSNVSLPGNGRAATFTSDDQVLVLGHFDGDGVTFVDSSAILGYEPAVSASSGESATFELLNARNPSTLGTFYARIYTYADR